MRYRDHAGSTERSLTRAEKHLPRLGKLSYVRGYFYQGRYGLDAGVIVRGENGTARFDGLSWGYNGTGPNGLVKLLTKLGVDEVQAKKTAYESSWKHDKPMEAWRISLIVP